MAMKKIQSNSDSRRSRASSCVLPSSPLKVAKNVYLKKKNCKGSEKKEWEDATCSVCMEFPHNAVLLLCSSYNKGCRPYMCATGRRYSNCLDQYKKAYTKVTSTQSSEQSNIPVDNLSFNLDAVQTSEKVEVPELLCPLCRGQVKGWTVVEPARKYLNSKKRSCMQDNCPFVGCYKELKKHVRAKHPLARPREVDPVLEEKWKRFEHERERSDVISTIISSIPGAVVLGDYVLEPNQSGFYSEYDSDMDENLDDDTFFSMDPFGFGRDGGLFSRNRYHRDYNRADEIDFGMHRTAGLGSTATGGPGRGFRRIIFGRSRRPRQRGGLNRIP